MPSDGQEKRIFFLSKADQQSMQSKFADFLPWQSFARKNVGYLFAIAQGAQAIWDFDDDNSLKFWIPQGSPDPNLDLDHITDSVLEKSESLHKYNCSS